MASKRKRKALEAAGQLRLPLSVLEQVSKIIAGVKP